MPAFDRLLTDPTPDQVVGVLLEAVDTANRQARVGVLKPSRADYETFVKSHLSQHPEGMRVWLADGSSGTTYPGNRRQTLVGLAWWTAPQGARLVKVVGRRTTSDGLYGDQRHDSRFGPPEGGWPPLALIDPAPAMLRAGPGQPAELLLWCSCGALGTPQQLGWDGQRCGACHDHQKEHGTPPPQAGPHRYLAPGPLAGLAWAPSGHRLAGLVRYWAKHGTPGEMVFWDAATGEVREQHPFDMDMQTQETPFAAGGAVLAGGPHYECVFWDLETGKQLFRHRTRGREVECLALTPDGRALALDSRDGLLTCDVPGKGELTPRWPQRTGWQRAESLAFSPDGLVLAAGREKRQVALIDWDTGEERLLQPEGGSPSHRVKALAFSADGRFLAAGSAPGLGDKYDIQPPGFLDVYQTSDGKPLATWPACEVNACAFSPDGLWLFTGGTDRLVRVYEAPSWQLRWTLDGHVGSVVSITFSPDGQALTTASADGTVRCWPWRWLLGEERPAEQQEDRPAGEGPKPKQSTSRTRKSPKR